MGGNVNPGGRLRRAWRRSWFHKLLLVLAAALLLFEVVYLVAANGLLWSGAIVKLANGATPDLHLEINGPSWTLLPGRVHGRNVAFRFEDRNVQFFLTLESVVLDLSLWELPSKTFHATRARGEGAHYLFRHKVEEPKDKERRLAEYPRIPGFSDPPLITKARTPALSDDEYNLWTVWFEDVDVGVNELWFLEVRLRGRARASGGFYLQPERDAMTEPCTLVVETSTLDVGSRTLAEHFKGELVAQLHRHDPRKVEGAQVFTKISSKTNLAGAVPNLDFTQLYTEADGPKFDGGQGTLQLRTELKAGEWSQGSRIEYKTEALTATLDRARISGPLDLRAEIVHGGRKDSQARFGLESQRLQFELEGAPEKIEDPTARAVKLAMDASADLAETPRWVAASADLQGQLPALRWLNVPLRKPMFTAGNAKADLHAEWAEGRPGRAKLRLAAQQAALSLENQPVTFSGELRADAVYDAKAERGHFQTLRLLFPDVVASNVPIPGGVQADGDVQFWGLTPPKRLEGRLELRSETLEPIMPFLIPSDILRSLAKVLVKLGKTHAVIEFERSESKFDLQLKEARSGNVQAFGMLSKTKASKDPCGQFYIDGAVNAGLVLMNGETSIKPLVSADWWRERPEMNTWCNSTADASSARKTHAR